MNSTIVAALARHLLTVLAGGAAVKYQIDGASMDAIIGGLAAAAGVGWSIWDKQSNR